MVVDDATHESVAIVPEHTIGGDHLTRILDGICARRGTPAVIRTDNVLSLQSSSIPDDAHPVRGAARYRAA